ncbi:hypothetical protein HELRODRAFT_110638 [Helobdella robusta]|uniref:Uncharacterized protein n=1 Tax=Helobdella robusta TaxID=6412 RepID=T1EF38_HELRO|nr:hypothetical protein HELRODRAFT_110638 [Helobdella robusta]ESO07110.1 hypothetical protein HELRODRAFT_110638 [Helobdella robusta]
MILGDLGAEIIKIEKPETGDDTRSWGPPWVGKESAYFLSVNRNKKSVCVDMKTKEGSQIIRQLASMSDVFIENYVPNKLDEYQLGYEDLKKVNSKIIYCSITGFGPSGPYKHRGGYDLIATALGGLMYITGPEDGDPCRTGVALTDLHTGQYAVSSILASLLYRNERNTGIHIHCSLLNTQVASLTHIASNWLNCGQDAKRMGSGHPSIVPYQSFKTKDNGYFIIGAGNNDQFEELCEILNLSHLPKDDKFSSNAKRVANRKELNDIFTKKFASQTRQFWVEYFKKTQAEFPYGPINSIKEAFQDPQVCHNHMIQAMDHSSVGTIKVAAPPVQYDDVRLALQNPPPLLGEHTDEVLRQLLKYNQGDIEEMKRKKIIE